MELKPEQYQVLVESAPTMIWRSSADGQCDFFNDKWLSFTGLTLEDAVGEKWKKRVHPSDVDRCVHLYRTHFDRRETFEIEYRLLRHDGVYRYVLSRGAPVVDAEGRFGGFVGHCMDVHERRIAEEAKSTLVAMLAHELRTPLQTLSLCAREVVRASERGETTPRKQAGRIERQVERLQRLVRHASSGIEIIARHELDIEPVEENLVELVGDAVQLRNDVTERSIDFTFLVKGEPYPVLVDRDRLVQVLDILLDNAEKFSPSGARVSITVEFRSHEACVAVADEGAGIAAGDISRVGTPFFRGSNVSPREHPGIGLGLVIARSVAKAHGGRLEVGNRDSGGARAAFVLPSRLGPQTEAAS